MRRQAVWTMAVGVSVVLTGCDSVLDVRNDHVVGSGVMVTEERQVNGVFGVELSGVGHLLIERGRRERLIITTDDNVLPFVVSDVHGGRLVLGTAPHTSISPSRGIEYRLTVRALDEVAVSGAGVIEAFDIDTEFLRVTISGAGAVAVEGIADEQRVILSGAGRYDARWLTTFVTTADLSGATYAVVRVRDVLDASVSGAGVLEYIGRPAVYGSVSGVGVIAGVDE